VFSIRRRPEVAVPLPTIGRTVLYKLTEDDARRIQQQRSHDSTTGNMPRAGHAYPAVVVASYGDEALNLQVLLDGPDSHWATSRHEGDEPGTWAWPPRV
jgi:hypothetical protein